MRRLLVLVGLGGLACLGFGSALVLADQSKSPNEVTTVSGIVAICHSPPGNPNNLQRQEHTAKSILESNGHISHLGDIIPAFPYTVIDTSTTTMTYEGKNLGTIYPLGSVAKGVSGEKVLSDGCVISTGAAGETAASVSEKTIAVVITEPGPTITEPGKKKTETIAAIVVVPPATTTVAPISTVVTVPAGSTETVTLPERTVTVPPSTETINGEQVVRPSETVTLPGKTETETSGGTATVVTVTGPDTVVEPGDHATKEAVVTVTTPSETVHEPEKDVPLPEHRIKGDTATETVWATITEPATMVTLPGTTTTETVLERVVVPATMVTVSAAKTVVTVPPDSTTTVTLPERIATVPRTTETINGEVVVRQSELVTLPATTKTMTGGTTTMVATVTGPSTVGEAGSVATKRAVVTVTTPSRGVFRPPRIVHVEEKKLVVFVVYKKTCPPGTVLSNGNCSHTGIGKG
jgi:hypothetical protein